MRPLAQGFERRLHRQDELAHVLRELLGRPERAQEICGRELGARFAQRVAPKCTAIVAVTAVDAQRGDRPGERRIGSVERAELCEIRNAVAIVTNARPGRFTSSTRGCANATSFSPSHVLRE